MSTDKTSGDQLSSPSPLRLNAVKRVLTTLTGQELLGLSTAFFDELAPDELTTLRKRVAHAEGLAIRKETLRTQSQKALPALHDCVESGRLSVTDHEIWEDSHYDSSTHWKGKLHFKTTFSVTPASGADPSELVVYYLSDSLTWNMRVWVQDITDNIAFQYKGQRLKDIKFTSYMDGQSNIHDTWSRKMHDHKGVFKSLCEDLGLPYDGHVVKLLVELLIGREVRKELDHVFEHVGLEEMEGDGGYVCESDYEDEDDYYL
ncbi:hypothetical protein HK104_004786 [Borealophlyctis nickersoniae]|nr:hypothetical protein HK104_004786 [Borealophlyctis nickersoniae]